LPDANAVICPGFAAYCGCNVSFCTRQNFAAGPPEATCQPLAANPALPEADDIVAAFRAQRDPKPGS